MGALKNGSYANCMQISKYASGDGGSGGSRGGAGGPRWVPRPKGLGTRLGTPEGEAQSHQLPPPTLELLGAQEGPGERTRSLGRGVSRSAPSSPLLLPGQSVCRLSLGSRCWVTAGAIVSCGPQPAAGFPGPAWLVQTPTGTRWPDHTFPLFRPL